MVDTTNPLPSINEPVVDRYRRWSPLWYKWIKPLLETVKRTDGRVTEVVDNLAGKWTISVNQDNRVVGAITIDGSTATSEVGILADKFIVVHPAANGTTIQAFVVGSVGGVSTVGINGNLVVDDTILARHIDVATLSAIAANVGTVTAGLIQSTDGKSYWNLDTGEFVIGAP